MYWHPNSLRKYVGFVACSDEVIESYVDGLPVKEIFRQHSEAAFRDLEVYIVEASVWVISIHSTLSNDTLSLLIPYIFPSESVMLRTHLIRQLPHVRVHLEAHLSS